MIFENEDIVCEISKHLNGIELFKFLKVNKTTYGYKNNQIIKKNINNFMNSKIIRIQDRFRKYLDKVDFICGISDKANISINNLNSFMEEEFCLVNKYYLSPNGDIGTLLLTLVALYNDVFFLGGENVSIEEIERFETIVYRYIR